MDQSIFLASRQALRVLRNFMELNYNSNKCPELDESQLNLIHDQFP